MKKNRLTYGKDPGYQIPPGYMENLEARIMAGVQASEKPVSVPETAVKPFTVPEDYFASFEDRLMAKLPATQKESRIISLLNKESFYYAAGVAAVFVAILVNSFTLQPEPFTMDSLDMLTLETYIDESIDYSAPEASGMFSDELFSYAPAGPAEDINQEAVMEYLHEHLEEPSIIFNEN